MWRPRAFDMLFETFYLHTQGLQQGVLGPLECASSTSLRVADVAAGVHARPHEQRIPEQGTDDIELCVQSSPVRASPTIGQPKA
jgi:hypothetical protein